MSRVYERHKTRALLLAKLSRTKKPYSASLLYIAQIQTNTRFNSQMIDSLGKDPNHLAYWHRFFSNIIYFLCET